MERFRHILGACASLTIAASLLAFALGHSFWVLVGASFVLGAASTAMVHACEVALIDLAGDQLERAIGSASLFGAVGDLLGPFVLVVTAWRTATARDAESTATPTLVTTPGPSASPPVPSPLVTVAVSPLWMRLASAGDTLNTMSSAVGSATSTSAWFASTEAPSTALRRVTTPLRGARRVASSWARVSSETASTGGVRKSLAEILVKTILWKPIARALRVSC